MKTYIENEMEYIENEMEYIENEIGIGEKEYGYDVHRVPKVQHEQEG